jgi:hypothetical protein
MWLGGLCLCVRVYRDRTAFPSASDSKVTSESVFVHLPVGDRTFGPGLCACTVVPTAAVADGNGAGTRTQTVVLAGADGRVRVVDADLDVAAAARLAAAPDDATLWSTHDHTLTLA